MIEAIRAQLTKCTTRCVRVPRLRVKTARRFARGEDGMATVEFGIVALPFFALIFAVIETAMIFFAGQTLEVAVADSARLILTGQAQNQSFAQSDFKNAVCAHIHALFDCVNNLQVDVKTYASFSAISTSPPVDSQGNLQTASFGYTPGNACDIVMVRLMYPWPVYASLLGLGGLANLNGGSHLIMATAAFRNEPFGSGSC